MNHGVDTRRAHRTARLAVAIKSVRILVFAFDRLVQCNALKVSQQEKDFLKTRLSVTIGALIFHTKSVKAGSNSPTHTATLPLSYCYHIETAC